MNETHQTSNKPSKTLSKVSKELISPPLSPEAFKQSKNFCYKISSNRLKIDFHCDINNRSDHSSRNLPDCMLYSL